MNKISLLLNNKINQNIPTEINLTIGPNKTITAGECSPRAHNELKVGLYLFECRDILSRILFYVEGENRENFRLVCHKAALLTFKLFKYIVQIYPKDLITKEKGLTKTCKECPNLSSIIISGQEMLLEKFSEIITIEASLL